MLTTVDMAIRAAFTLDDVAAMAAADEHHRYELSREGVLTVAPPATPEHMVLVSRLMHWFFSHGFGPEQVVAECGIDIGGGRQPDLTVWGGPVSAWGSERGEAQALAEAATGAAGYRSLYPAVTGVVPGGA